MWHPINGLKFELLCIKVQIIVLLRINHLTGTLINYIRHLICCKLEEIGDKNQTYVINDTTWFHSARTHLRNSWIVLELSTKILSYTFSQMFSTIFLSNMLYTQQMITYHVYKIQLLLLMLFVLCHLQHTLKFSLIAKLCLKFAKRQLA